METKLPQPTSSTKSPSPITIDVSAFDRELPYLLKHGVPFEVIERNEGSDMIRIRITVLDSYTLASYGIAMSNMGFDMGKAIAIPRMLYPKSKEVA